MKGRRRARQRHRRAFTLAEALIASMILGILAAAAAHALYASTRQAYEAALSRMAASLVEDLLDEIVRLPYADPNGTSSPGPEAGESNRTLFDNVDDYHGYAESAGSAVDAAGIAYPSEYAPLARSVSVTATTLEVPGFSTGVVGVTVTVSVTSEGRNLASGTRFVAAPPP